MECSLETLVELGICSKPDKKPLRKTAEQLEKTADIQQLLRALAAPPVRAWAARRGLVLGDFFGKKPLSRVIEEGKFQDEVFKALHGAAQADRPGWERFFEGLAALSGNDITPGMRNQSRALSGDIASISPYLQLLAPELWDRLHGSRGSVGSLVRAVAETGRYSGTQPEQAERIAEAVYNGIYGDGNPAAHQGFAAKDLAKIYTEAARRGLIPLSGDPEAITSELLDILQPIGAIRDKTGAQTRDGADIPKLFRMYDSLRNVAGPLATPMEIAAEIRAGDYLKRRTGGVGGAFAAAMQERGGFQRPDGVSFQTAMNQHRKLLENSLQSPVANMAGATIRMGKEIGYTAGSRGEDLYKQVSSGDMPYLDYEDWLRIVGNSGIDEDTAAEILNQSTRNAMYASPKILEGIRRSQYRYDIEPYVMQLNSRYPGQDVQSKSMYAGQLDELAKLYGYKDWTNIKQLHGPSLFSAADIQEEARQRGAAESLQSGVGRGGPVQRTFDAIRDAAKPGAGVKTTIDDVFFRSIGAIPKTSLKLEPWEKFSSAMTPIKATLFLRSYHVYSTERNEEAEDTESTVGTIGNIIKADKGNNKHIPTVAVDLDGTLASYEKGFDPNNIEDPRPGAQRAMKEFQRRGFRIIIFTTRGDKQLVKDWLHEHDIPYDYVNENPDQPPDASGKVIADVYIDDRAVDGSQSWSKTVEQTVKRVEKTAGFRSKAKQWLKKWNPVSPVMTFTSGGGPGVGVSYRGTPFITDIDVTGPGAGVGLPPSVVAKLMREVPGERSKMIADRIEKMPGKIYVGVELAGPMPTGFLGVAASTEDAKRQAAMWNRFRKDLKVWYKRKKRLAAAKEKALKRLPQIGISTKDETIQGKHTL